MKDLPKVFHNNINKTFNNNEEFFYSSNEANDINKLNTNKNYNADKTITQQKNIYQKINDIFSAPNYVYKANVEITTKDSSFTTKIIGRNKNYLITMDNKTIPIVDIVDINMK